MTKTTIAIIQESRKSLGKIKCELERRSGGRFVDMDEVVQYLLDNMPSDMQDLL